MLLLRHMRLSFLYVLLFLMAGCTGQLFEHPITSENGLAFMASRDLYNESFDTVEAISLDNPPAEGNTSSEESFMDCPAENAEDW